MEKTEKLSFGEWFENIWYHYKWLIIFIGLVVIFLVMSLFQFIATDDPDVNILHVGPMYLSATAVDDAEETLKNFSEDYNDDGEFLATILDITINKVGSMQDVAVNYDHNNSALQRFQTEIRAGDAVIYALDKEYFDICLSENLLTPLDEVIDDIDMPENTVSDDKGTVYGVYISDLDAYTLPGLRNFPEGAILCLRRSPDKDAIKYGRTMEIWEGNRKTFVNIIKYRDTSKTHYDINFMYSGFREVSDEVLAKLDETLKSFSADYNNDSSHLVEKCFFTFEKDGSNLAETQDNVDSMNAFEVELYTGDSMIYILDREMFDICVTEELLAPVNEIFTAEEMPDAVINGYGFYLSDIGLDKLPGFENIAANAVICLRRSPETETIRFGRTLTVWENNRDTFKNIIASVTETFEESEDTQETP